MAHVWKETKCYYKENIVEDINNNNNDDEITSKQNNTLINDNRKQVFLSDLETMIKCNGFTILIHSHLLTLAILFINTVNFIIIN